MSRSRADQQPPQPEDRCRHTLITGPGRLGPTVGDPLYELGVNGEDHAARALYDAVTWPEQMVRRAHRLAAVAAGLIPGSSS